MSFQYLKKEVKYSVEIDRVKELMIRGNADLAYWKEALKVAGLHPTNINGKAFVYISTTNATYSTLRFREVSIYVGISKVEDGDAVDALFLAHAYNSSPLLAMLERRLFYSPHSPGYIQTHLRLNTNMRLIVGDTTLLDAEMAVDTYVEFGKKLVSQNEIWEGPVFLPDLKGLYLDKSRYYFSKMEGLTYTIPFALDKDIFNIRPNLENPVIRQLADSHFTPEEWAIREEGGHLKSKTYSYRT